jgi:hypothetical protein
MPPVEGANPFADTSEPVLRSRISHLPGRTLFGYGREGERAGMVNEWDSPGPLFWSTGRACGWREASGFPDSEADPRGPCVSFSCVSSSNSSQNPFHIHISESLSNSERPARSETTSPRLSHPPCAHRGPPSTARVADKARAATAARASIIATRPPSRLDPPLGRPPRSPRVDERDKRATRLRNPFDRELAPRPGRETRGGRGRREGSRHGSLTTRGPPEMRKGDVSFEWNHRLGVGRGGPQLRRNNCTARSDSCG